MHTELNTRESAMKSSCLDIQNVIQVPLALTKAELQESYGPVGTERSSPIESLRD